VLGVLFATAVLVGWTLIFTQYYLLRAASRGVSDLGVGYWMLLSLGCLFLLAVAGALVWLLLSALAQARRVRQQDTFLDSVSHELRTPLASLELSLDTLARPELPAAERVPLLAMMRADTRRLRSFVEKILEANRLAHSSRPRPSLQRVDMVAACQAAAEEACRRAFAPRERVRVEIAARENDSAEAAAALAADLVVHADPLALAVILVNLVENALKYSPRDAVVDVVLGHAGACVVAEVRDHGRGFSPRERSRLFRRFSRLEPHGGIAVPGTGLGLFVSKQLALQLGARLSAESAGVGKGAAFRLEIPRGAVRHAGSELGTPLPNTDPRTGTTT
jgi:signal transduction histidine kinase